MTPEQALAWLETAASPLQRLGAKIRFAAALATRRSELERCDDDGRLAIVTAELTRAAAAEQRCEILA